MTNRVNDEISGIIRVGLLLGSLGISLLLISLVFGVFRQNPFGIITDPSCIAGSDAVSNLVISYVFSICAPYFAALLAKGLQATLSFTSLHEIFIRVWVLLSEAILGISYVFFYTAMVDSLQLMLDYVSCGSENFGLAIIFGVMFRLVYILILIIIRR